jgi:hypothetical protein
MTYKWWWDEGIRRELEKCQYWVGFRERELSLQYFAWISVYLSNCLKVMGGLRSSIWDMDNNTKYLTVPMWSVYLAQCLACSKCSQLWAIQSYVVIVTQTKLKLIFITGKRWIVRGRIWNRKQNFSFPPSLKLRTAFTSYQFLKVPSKYTVFGKFLA